MTPQEYTFEEFKAYHQARNAGMVAIAEKYRQFTLVALEQDRNPHVLLIKNSLDTHGGKLILLTAVAMCTLDIDAVEFVRYREKYCKSVPYVGFDIPRTLVVTDAQPAIRRYSPAESGEIQQITEVVDLDSNEPFHRVDATIKQSPGISFNIVANNPSLNGSMGRYLAETHNYQHSRSVYVL